MTNNTDKKSLSPFERFAQSRDSNALSTRRLKAKISMDYIQLLKITAALAAIARVPNKPRDPAQRTHPHEASRPIATIT